MQNLFLLCNAAGLDNTALKLPFGMYGLLKHYDSARTGIQFDNKTWIKNTAI
jgi:hypothetical protein